MTLRKKEIINNLKSLSQLSLKIYVGQTRYVEFIEKNLKVCFLKLEKLNWIDYNDFKYLPISLYFPK